MKVAYLEQYKKLVALIRGQFGDSCQAVLYELNNHQGEWDGEALALSGTTTEARVGDPLPDYLLTHLAENGPQDRYGMINKTLTGLVLRTSIMFIITPDYAVVGALCIHHNIVHIKMITSFLEELTRPANLEEDDRTEPEESGEKVYTAGNIQGFLDSIISEFVVERLGSQNFSALSKADKLALIAELDQRGVFLVKGAVNMVANRISVSKFSLYNYLDEIRTKRANQ